MAHDVFICYSDADRQAAEAVCATLEAGGISCWIAPRNIAAGGSWTEAIMDAIGESRVMVVIWSAKASSSPYVTLEVKHACTQGVTVVLFRVEDVTPHKDLNFFLAFVQWLDAWTPPIEAHYRRLTETVRARLTAGAAALSPQVDGVETRPRAPTPSGRAGWRRLRWPAALAVLLFLCAGYYALTKDPAPTQKVLEPAPFTIAEQKGQNVDKSQVTALPAQDAELPNDIPVLETKDGKITIWIPDKKAIVIYHKDERRMVQKESACRIRKSAFLSSSVENMLIITCENGVRHLWDVNTGNLVGMYPHS